jgi:methylmalonyl-CoA mutase
VSLLSEIVGAVEGYDQFVQKQIHRAGSDEKFAAELLARWRQIRKDIPSVSTPTGVVVPRIALPIDEHPTAIARYLFGEGLPGEFPFANAIYRQMYSQSSPSPGTPGEGPHPSPRSGRDFQPPPEHQGRGKSADALTEEPTRLFAGLGVAEDTNRRFHYIARHQRNVRLSTAFDGPTLYGMDSDDPAVFGKIGEGGVAIDTVDDMTRLYDGFPLDDEHFSVSMTINGPAPMILAMYVASVIRKYGKSAVAKLRGTVQADVLKEVQAQNEMLFPLDAALRLLGDMIEFTTGHMPRWYPISISGYHIAEAGATPIQQAAYTLSNGFAYVDLLRRRGLDLNRFGPRLSFFLDCGLDLEYLALARVCRRIWAIAMRDVFQANESAQRFKLHTQTSGRSLIARGFQNNLTRTAVELLLAYANATNSCHSNSADEPFTTPSEHYVRLAASSQAILLEESGLFKFMTNTLSGSPGMKIVEAAVQKGILEELRRIDHLGGVLAAVEFRYQRSQIQEAAHHYERQILDGTRPIVGLNRYHDEAGDMPRIPVVRTPAAKKRGQIARVRQFKRRHAKSAAKALDSLSRTVETGGNVFAELIQTVEHCSLGQITARLQKHFGRFRPMV